MTRNSLAIITGLIAVAGGLPCHAQPAPLVQLPVAYRVDSGPVDTLEGDAGEAYQQVIEVPDATWMQLHFDRVVLAPGRDGLGESILRITSLADGAMQHLDQEALQQWQNRSAYFNGDAVKIEILAAAGSVGSRVELSQIMVGPPYAGAVASICGPEDDRVASDDPRVARTAPNGCTSWIIDDFNHCMVTAGHCDEAQFQSVHFNVPDSNPNGSVNFPPPEDQYAVDPASIQSENTMMGRDWTYFGVFDNTETGLSPFETQGSAFELEYTPPPPTGQLRVTGYGTDDTPMTANQVQQTHAGPHAGIIRTAIRHRADTTPGNSGSPIIDEATGRAVGIHTIGGCSGLPDTFNSGTAFDNGNFRNALANPSGVCTPVLPVTFVFPDGLPPTLDPDGEVIRVVVMGDNGGSPQPGTGLLYYDDGSGPVTIPMVENTPNDYDAIFPPLACGKTVTYSFSAEDTDGAVVNEPLLAPADVYEAIVAESYSVVFNDDFEGDLGWIVAGVALDGEWERSVPLSNGCGTGAPEEDADGSSACFLTDNDRASCESDVDAGSTVLVSPTLDATLAMPAISYWRWLDNTGAGTGLNQFEDIMLIEISDDNGFTWVELETVGPGGIEVQGGWYKRVFLVEDFITPTNEFRIRFDVFDVGGASTVEAAIDGVQLIDLDCIGPPCPWDCGDGNGIVDTTDFLALLAEWGQVGSPCDIDGGGVGTTDFLALLGMWGSCP